MFIKLFKNITSTFLCFIIITSICCCRGDNEKEKGSTLTDSVICITKKSIDENYLSYMKPVYKDNSYEYNPFSINNELIDEYGKNYYNFYYNFINAYINYENTCHCPCQEFSDTITEIELCSFPLLSSNYGIEGSVNYDYTTKTISWKYECKNKQEHISNYNNFKNIINSYFKNISDTDSDTEKAKKLFCNYNKGKKYDYDAIKTKNNINGYYGLISDRGICVTFSYAFNYLLNQLNIENYVVYCDIENDALNEGHDWNVVKLNNKFYFCDTTFQITCNDTNKLKYFGFSMNERMNDGFKYNKEKMAFGTLKPKNISEIEISKDNLNK